MIFTSQNSYVSRTRKSALRHAATFPDVKLVLRSPESSRSGASIPPVYVHVIYFILHIDPNAQHFIKAPCGTPIIAKCHQGARAMVAVEAAVAAAVAAAELVQRPH